MDIQECLLVGFFCVVFLAPLSLSEHFEVISPPSVIGNVGQDAVLPCQISLQTQPQKMEVKWLRIGDKHIDNIYQFTAVTGEETFGPGYLGRIGLLKEGMATGNVSLKLKKVQVNDEGTYRCIVKSSDWIAQTQTVLHAAALGNVSIEVLGPEGEGIKLACKSAGWFPKPELQWLAKNSQNPQFESKQDHEQLFSVWSNITVLSDSGEITCSVHERSYSSMKQESTILLSRDIFPHTSLWLVVFWILFILTLLAVGVLAFFIHKGKEKKKKKKRDEKEKIMLLENTTKTLESGELEEFRRKCKELESKLEEKQQQIQILESQVKTKEEEIHDLKKQLEDQKKVPKTRVAEIRKIYQENEDLKREREQQSQVHISYDQLRLEVQKSQTSFGSSPKRARLHPKNTQLFNRLLSMMENDEGHA